MDKPISPGVKISLLLMRFFYQTKRLRLPGLGIFTLDKNAAIPEASDNQAEMPNGALFQRVTVSAPDPELIAFISENTGKIKPLATSDLESFLGLGIEMLNIGKPFLLEGIGTVYRHPAGKYEFTPGHFGVMPTETPVRDLKPVTDARRSAEPEKIAVEAATHSDSMGLADHRNLLRVVVLLVAVLIIGGGGYLLYRNRTAAANPADNHVVVADLMSQEDKAGLPSDNPTVATPVAAAPVVSEPPASAVKPVDSAELKFVILSTPNKAHALRRYNQLISFDLKPKLYQKDSTWFKVYFEFPASAKDTLHIKDSLHRQYDANVSIDR